MAVESTIRIAGVVRESIVDGPGIRFAVFCQGCPHDCPGCHNPNTHDFDGGSEISVDRILDEIDQNPILKGVTFTGGEPLCQPKGFLQLAKKVHERGLDITLFSGFTYEEIVEMSRKDENISELLNLTDILIDGPYMESQRDLTLKFRGSGNQRVIDMNETRRIGQLTLMD